VKLYVFLTLALERGEWSPSFSDCLIMGRNLWYPLDRMQDGPQSYSGCGFEKKRPHSARN
jgi:hypothetical protein